MRSLLIIILIFPCIIFAQESMVIKHLTNAINSVGAELNFFQDEKRSIFVDNVHIADRGNRLIANKLLEIIKLN